MKYTLRGKKENRRVLESEGVAPKCIAFNMNAKDIESYLTRYTHDSVHRLQISK